MLQRIASEEVERVIIKSQENSCLSELRPCNEPPFIKKGSISSWQDKDKVELNHESLYDQLKLTNQDRI